jgi:serine protease Do
MWLMRRISVLGFFGCSMFLGAMAGSFLVARGGPDVFAQAPAATRPIDPDPTRGGDRFEAVVRKLSSSVVALEALKPAVKEGTKSVDDSGSGVLVRFAGHKGLFVLTNNHVIGKAPANQITINIADSRILKPTRVWADPESDIALLGVPEGDNLTPATLGDSDKMRVGQWVLAFGSPFGLNQTVTHGIISARERGQVHLGSTIRIKDFLQTDAAINPGSSGGPLVNLDGEVIGINTAIASPPGGPPRNSGIAFSIPINMIKKVALQLLDKGRVTRGYLGVQLSPGFESSEATRLGLDKAQGALVDSVHPETPAATAGLQRQDVILELDGGAVRNENQFINRISVMPPGQKIKLKVWREKRTLTVDAVIGDWSKAETRFKR